MYTAEEQVELVLSEKSRPQFVSGVLNINDVQAEEKEALSAFALCGPTMAYIIHFIRYLSRTVVSLTNP